MLVKQLIDLPLGVGVNQKTRYDLIDARSSAIEVLNLRVDKLGSYNKRKGYDSLAPVPSGKALRLGQYRGSPVCFDGTSIFSYSDYLTETGGRRTEWSTLGKAEGCIARRFPVKQFNVFRPNPSDTPRGMYGYNVDAGYIGGLTGIIWCSQDPLNPAANYAIQACVVDSETQAMVVPPTTLVRTIPANERRFVRAVGVDNVLVFFFSDASVSPGRILSSYVDLNNVSAGLSTPVVVASGVNYSQGSGCSFDVCALDAKHYVLGYLRTAGGIALQEHTARGSVPVVTAFIPEHTSNGSPSFPRYNFISLACGFGTLWILEGTSVLSSAYLTAVRATNIVVGTGTPAQVLFEDGGVGSASGFFAGTVVPTGVNECTVAASFLRGSIGAGASARPNVSTRWTKVVVSAGACTPSFQRALFRHGIRGKGFQQNGSVYVPLYNFAIEGDVKNDGKVLAPVFATQASSLYLARMNYSPTDTVVSVAAVTGHHLSAVPFQAHISGYGPGDQIVPYPEIGTGMVAGNTWAGINLINTAAETISLQLTTFDFNDSNQWQNAEIGTSLALVSGVPSIFDGQHVSELSFFEDPVMVIPTAVPAFGGGVPAGTYAYTAIYEWVTATGNIVQSEPCVPTLITTTAEGSIRLDVYTLQLSNRPEDGAMDFVKIVVYRTAGTLGTGAYQRISEAAIRANDHFSDTVTVFDTITPSFLQTQPLLYTQPGAAGTALPRVSPPSASCMVVHRDRLWYVADDGITIWYSGQFVDGEQAWFSDLFTFQVPKGGPITALVSMDGILYIFKRDTIFSVTGEGPADNGSGNDLSSPEEMDVELGCVNPRSIIVAPGGTFFQSARGIYLLARSRSLEYIGAGIESSQSQRPYLVAANVIDDEACIYLEANTTDSGTGPDGLTFVYDFTNQIWMIDQKLAADTGLRTSAVDATVINGRYYWVTANGLFNGQSTGYFDGGRWVTGELTTGWFRMNGVQGYQRLRKAILLFAQDGDDVGAYGVHVGIARDYNSSFFDQEWQWRASDIAAIVATTGDAAQLQMNMEVQKLESIAFTITDLNPDVGTSTGRGPAWNALTVEVGVKQGTFKLPEANTK